MLAQGLLRCSRSSTLLNSAARLLLQGIVPLDDNAQVLERVRPVAEEDDLIE